MNEWNCEQPGCDATCVGHGGAIGLRAIGWFFEPRVGLFCPVHRPDKSEKRIRDVPCSTTGPCSHCKAEEEADRLQYVIVKALEITGESRDFTKRHAERWDD